MDAHEIIAPNEWTWHEAPEAGKVASIAANMTASGWVGAPVLVHASMAVTGTHRIAAARVAGIDAKVLTLDSLTETADADIAVLIEATGCDQWAAVKLLFAHLLEDAASYGEDLLEDLPEDPADVPELLEWVA